MPISPIDLTTISNVYSQLGQNPGSDDATIQGFITNYSRNILKRTGRRNLTAVTTYADVYSGNGRNQMQLREYPIVSVTSLVINGQTIPQSQAWNNPGWAIDPEGESSSIVLIGTQGRYGAGETMTESVWLGTQSYRFFKGMLNVSVAYTAGYDGTPEDLQQAATELVALMYRRRSWIGQTTVNQPQVGTTTYLRLEMEIGTKGVIDRYTKRFIA
jgi:hypothetical protein